MIFESSIEWKNFLTNYQLCIINLWNEIYLSCVTYTHYLYSFNKMFWFNNEKVLQRSTNILQNVPVSLQLNTVNKGYHYPVTQGKTFIIYYYQIWYLHKKSSLFFFSCNIPINYGKKLLLNWYLEVETFKHVVLHIGNIKRFYFEHYVKIC